ncbi:hypothetical protein QLL95_gp0452 [Cotonvirus japonicus]|uniref:Uncharacterized protein n=1 Tax=Cotonvirus japonicus TaxID=2811091 RepID=A0ABM7NUD7_9VIRU|nr:hypothetical protein QLL95_gp0452 [Cotonvirus japonicus]BCS83671.1 hypothetical protein [Cotonvirus japonicus]
MKLKDFIEFPTTYEDLGTIFLDCNADDDFKSLSYDDKEITLVDNSEALLLINRAKNSFLTHKKLKDKYVKGKCEFGEEEYQITCYLSTDHKFYCVYFCYYMDDHEFYYFGIIEKQTDKHLFIVYNQDYNGVKLNIEHHMFNYECDSDMYDEEKLMYPPIDDKTKPLDIICCLEDYFNMFYKDMYIKDFDDSNDSNDSNDSDDSDDRAD